MFQGGGGRKVKGILPPLSILRDLCGQNEGNIRGRNIGGIQINCIYKTLLLKKLNIDIYEKLN